MRRVLFSSDIIGEIKPCPEFTPIEWKNVSDPNEINWTKNDGYHVLQGTGKHVGRIFGGTAGPLRQIMGTKYYPSADFFDGAFVMLEAGMIYDSGLAFLHELRSFAASGMFDKAKGIITKSLDAEEREILLKVINKEVHREDMIILENVDFVHRTPMTVIPMGAKCEIDCDNVRFSILEPGVC